LIERGRAFERAVSAGGVEFRDIARNDLAIERQRRAGCGNRLGAERMPYLVQRLVERVPGLVFAGIGPEIGEELVAAQPGLAGGCQDREQREAPALRGRAGIGGPIAGQGQPAERNQAKHGV
jgi:hypothetical protein